MLHTSEELFVAKKKMQLPSRTAIAKVLSGAVLDPRAEGPFHVIATTAGRQYHEMRAVEMIREAVDAFELNGELTTYMSKMSMALSLLALAMLETQATADPQPTPA
jgi:hypothetical protein